MKLLTSDSNPQFRRWLRLAQTPRAVRESGETLAEGLHLAEAIAASQWPVVTALVRRGSQGEAIDRALARLGSQPQGFELAASLYDRISPVEHGAGLILVVPTQTAEVPLGSTEDLIYLDGVQDPSNVGALLRTGAAAGIAHVLCGAATASAWSPRSLRAAMGAHFRLRISESVDPEALTPALAGSWIGAVVQDGASLWSCDLPRGAIGWAFGSEGAGLSEDVLSRCALRVRIPISRDVESLNVAAAAAVCLFERKRRRDAGSAQVRTWP